MDAVTTLVKHDPKTFNGQNGEWTLHIFEDSNGTKFQTNKQQIANAAYALLGQQVKFPFEVEERGKWKNNVIGAAPVAAPGETPTPTSNPNSGGGRSGGRGGYTPKDQGVINRSAALARAIETVAAGIVPVAELGGFVGLTKLADSYVKYIETAPQGQGGAVSSDGGGANGAEAPTSAPTAAAAEAPAAAPAAAPAVAPATADDDIPF